MIHYSQQDGTYVISSRGMWLAGIYDSERAARYAFRFPDETLQALCGRICHCDQENRPISMDDLRAARKAMRTGGQSVPGSPDMANISQGTRRRDQHHE